MCSGIGVELLTRLISQCDAYTRAHWHGPFDKVPEPAIGEESVDLQLEQSISELTLSSNQLLALAAKNKHLKDLEPALSQYYAKTIAQLEGHRRNLGVKLTTDDIQRLKEEFGTFPMAN